jgi:hypothetical protein
VSQLARSSLTPELWKAVEGDYYVRSVSVGLGGFSGCSDANSVGLRRYVAGCALELAYGGRSWG